MKTKKLQRLFLVSFGILLLAGVSGCAGVPASGSGQKQEGSASESADPLSEIRDRGKIVFAMEGQWAPWTYHDESGELVGYDTEVGKAIAAVSSKASNFFILCFILFPPYRVMGFAGIFDLEKQKKLISTCTHTIITHL